ncbi:MAG: Fe-S cluster assembly protein SufD [Bryobacterales bacterium]|nr:Fe-S cluster assembly protein SufD [Bryobacteraceae bacterium]MDW8354208.1 Fe-S cluster assembly protein SufD [Bryobacterales bacterium]
MAASVKEAQDLWLDAFLEAEQRWRDTEPARLRKLRAEAWDRFRSLGFPTTKHEEWKYTNVAPLARTAFRTAEPAEPAAGVLPDSAVARLVFVNGRFEERLSSASWPAGVRAGSLRDLSLRAVVEERLGCYARFDQHPFVALNTALFEDGAVVEIARGAVVEQPLWIIHLAVPSGQPSACHPRVLVAAGEQSQASVIELYLSAGQGIFFTNAVTELAAAQDAIIEHYRIQQEALSAYHVATVQYHQGRGASILSHNVAFGAGLARNDVNSVLDGEGAECILNGLYVAGGEQLVDNHTALDHAQPHTSSREFYKGVLDGKATGVFNGKIMVRPGAQKTDAIQSNKNLLLSPEASINTKPQLEIYADDVRCTHGATVGQLDEEAIFYFRTRGIPRDTARELLTFAFAADVLGRMKVEPVREQLERELFRRLRPSGNRGEGA